MLILNDNFGFKKMTSRECTNGPEIWFRPCQSRMSRSTRLNDLGKKYNNS